MRLWVAQQYPMPIYFCIPQLRSDFAEIRSRPLLVDLPSRLWVEPGDRVVLGSLKDFRHHDMFAVVLEITYLKKDARSRTAYYLHLDGEAVDSIKKTHQGTDFL